MPDLGAIGISHDRLRWVIPHDSPFSWNITNNPIQCRMFSDRYEAMPRREQWAQFSGTVLNASGAPVARTVRVVRRSDGYELGETTSSASTGAWSIAVPVTSEVQILCLDDAAGTLDNDLIHRVLPA